MEGGRISQLPWQQYLVSHNLLRYERMGSLWLLLLEHVTRQIYCKMIVGRGEAETERESEEEEESESEEEEGKEDDLREMSLSWNWPINWLLSGILQLFQ
jgi:hypothetical protein